CKRTSLRSSEARGTTNPDQRLENVAAPNSATAASGAKLGGCGASRLSAAIPTSAVRNQKRGRLMKIPLSGFLESNEGWRRFASLPAWLLLRPWSGQGHGGPHHYAVITIVEPGSNAFAWVE